jgi:hypothetical protein
VQVYWNCYRSQLDAIVIRPYLEPWLVSGTSLLHPSRVLQDLRTVLST